MNRIGMNGPMSDDIGGPVDSPWVLVDNLTVNQTADLLERLVGWLDGPDHEAATRCAQTMSLGESHDPETIAGWADALAARLRERAEEDPLFIDATATTDN